MKTIKFCLLLAILAIPVVIFSNFRPDNKPVLKTTIHSDAFMNRIRVVVDRPSTAPVTLRITDHEGWPIHEESLPTGGTRTQANLNLGAVEDGTYRLEISGVDYLDTYSVDVMPSVHPSYKRQIVVWPIP